MRSVIGWAWAVLILALAGCSGQPLVEGKVKIDSTSVFKNNKAMKSKPPQKPSN